MCLHVREKRVWRGGGAEAGGGLDGTISSGHAMGGVAQPVPTLVDRFMFKFHAFLDQINPSILPCSTHPHCSTGPLPAVPVVVALVVVAVVVAPWRVQVDPPHPLPPPLVAPGTMTGVGPVVVEEGPVDTRGPGRASGSAWRTGMRTWRRVGAGCGTRSGSCRLGDPPAFVNVCNND
jgi:hypothetical protein